MRRTDALKALLEELGQVYHENGDRTAVRFSDRPHADINGEYVAVAPNVREHVGRDLDRADELRCICDTLSHEIEHINRSVLTGKRDFSAEYPECPKLAGMALNLLEDLYIDKTRTDRFPGMRKVHAFRTDQILSNHHRHPRVDNIDEPVRAAVETAFQVGFAGYAKGISDAGDNLRTLAARTRDIAERVRVTPDPDGRVDLAHELMDALLAAMPDGADGADADAAAGDAGSNITDAPDVSGIDPPADRSLPDPSDSDAPDIDPADAPDAADAPDPDLPDADPDFDAPDSDADPDPDGGPGDGDADAGDAADLPDGSADSAKSRDRDGDPDAPDADGADGDGFEPDGSDAPDTDAGGSGDAADADIGAPDSDAPDIDPDGADADPADAPDTDAGDGDADPDRDIPDMDGPNKGPDSGGPFDGGDGDAGDSGAGDGDGDADPTADPDPDPDAAENATDGDSSDTDAADSDAGAGDGTAGGSGDSDAADPGADPDGSDATGDADADLDADPDGMTERDGSDSPDALLDDMDKMDENRESGAYHGVDDDEDYHEPDPDFERRAARVARESRKASTDIGKALDRRDERLDNGGLDSIPDFAKAEAIRESLAATGDADAIADAFREIKSADRPRKARAGDSLNMDGIVNAAAGDMGEDKFYLRTDKRDPGDRTFGVLVDLSGSMTIRDYSPDKDTTNGEAEAKKALAALALAAEEMGDDFLAGGFQTDPAVYVPDGSDGLRKRPVDKIRGATAPHLPLAYDVITAPGERFEFSHLDAASADRRNPNLHLDPISYGMEKTAALMDKAAGRDKVMVVITDGEPTVMSSSENVRLDDDGDKYGAFSRTNAPVREAADVIEGLRADGVTVIGIGTGGDINPRKMDMMFGEDGYVMTEHADLADRLIEVYRRYVTN